ncbi:MAG: hypothetical protein IPM53_05755 [Anaerolineaceae bacterium]|nr:hypothetical protein [Anaerolineaceae bacterium]
MATQNKTAEFLLHEYSWNKASLALHDVQPLSGGVVVRLPGWTTSQALVSRFAPGGAETKYKLPLKWTEGEKAALIDLCVAHDFLTIQPEERPGIPDEARPSLTLTNSKGESHTITKWAGVADARFDAIYQALLALAARSEGQRPLPKRFNSAQKGAVIAGLAVGVLLLALLGCALAWPLVNGWWPERFGLLLVLLLILMALLLAGMAGLARWERPKPRWDRSFTHPWVVMAVNMCFFLAVIGAWGLGETAVSAWRSDALPVAGDERLWYAVLGYAAVFTAVLLVVAAGRFMTPLLNLIDERF